jgi:hypothetical protein
VPRFLKSLIVSDATDATASNTGAIQTPGGIYCGQTLRVVGLLTSTNTTDSTTPLNGAIQTAGGVGCNTLSVNSVPNLPSQAANKFFASPNGSSGAPIFRSILATDLPVFGPSGAGHAPGAVPDPGVTSGATRYLREDGNWVTPAGAGGGTTVYGGTAILDFGTNQMATSVAVTGQPNVLTTSNIHVTVQAVDTANKAADEVILDPIVVAVGPATNGVGFTIYGIALNRYTSGKYQVAWSYF